MSRVLICDDMESDLFLIKMQCARLGVDDIVAVKTAAEALQAFKEAQASATYFDVVFLDYLLAEKIYGTELARQIRQLDKERRSKIVIITSYSNSVQDLYLEKGDIDACIRKEIDFNVVEMKLKEFIVS